MINGRGLYYCDTVSSATQQQGNDLVTLVVGLPLLAISTWLAFRGSLRGRLLLTGTLGFFLYTYMSMSMLTAYNSLFLAYVALFSLSRYSFILSMMSFDLTDLPQHFSSRLPHGWIAGLMFFAGGFLLLALHQPLASSQNRLVRNMAYWLCLLLLIIDPLNLSLGPFLYGGDALGIAVGLQIDVWVVQVLAFALFVSTENWSPKPSSLPSASLQPIRWSSPLSESGGHRVPPNIYENAASVKSVF